MTDIEQYFVDGLKKIAQKNNVPESDIRVKIVRDKTDYFTISYHIYNGSRKIGDTNIADLFNLGVIGAVMANKKVEDIFKKIAKKYSIATQSLGIKVFLDEEQPLLWVYNGILPVSEEEGGFIDLQTIDKI